MMHPLISVIVPNYNHSLYLEKRISSILEQTYDNIELILLDDCSTDNSSDILRSYAKHPKVLIVDINNINSGSTFKQWKKGLMYAQGDYIWIAESDDYADTLFLEKSIKLMMQTKNASICYAGSYLVDSKGDKLDMDWDKWTSNEIACDSTHKIFNGDEFILNNLIWKNEIYNASAVLFRKDFYFKIDSAYESFKYCGDHLFWIEMSRYGEVIKVFEKLNYFRQHANKVSPRSAQIGLQFLEGFEVFDYIQRTCKLSRIKRNAVLGRVFKRINAYKSYINTDKKKEILEEYKARYGNGKVKQIAYILYKIFNGI